MFSRSSSVSSVFSISKDATKRFAGRIYVANSTNFEWQIEILTNELGTGCNPFHPEIIGPHQVSQLLYSYSSRTPIIVKATKKLKNDENENSKSYEKSVSTKSGLIITDVDLTLSKRRWKSKFLKKFASGDNGDFWKPKFDDNLTYDPHRNITKGATCRICKAQNTESSSDEESCKNEIEPYFNNMLFRETKEEEGNINTV